MKKRRSGPFLIVPLAEPHLDKQQIDEKTIYRAAIVLSIHLEVSAVGADRERESV